METKRVYLKEGNHDVLFTSAAKTFSYNSNHLIVFEGLVVKSTTMPVGTEVAYVINMEDYLGAENARRILKPCVDINNGHAIANFLEQPFHDILRVKAFTRRARTGRDYICCEFKPFLPKFEISLGKSILCRLGGDEF